MDVNEKNQESEISLSDVLYLLKRKLLGVIIFAIIGGLVVGLYTFFRIAPTYEATSKVYIVSTSESVIKLSDLQLGTSLAADYQQLLKTRPVMQQVIQKLNLDMKYSELSNMISIKNPSDTRILTITATTKDPELSAQIATAMAEVAQDYLPDVMDSSKTPRIIETALAPTSAVGPNYIRNIVIGAVVMAVLYFAFCFIQFILDDTIKGEADIERYFGITPLAVIPEYKDLDKEESDEVPATKGTNTAKSTGGEA